MSVAEIPVRSPVPSSGLRLLVVSLLVQAGLFALSVTPSINNGVRFGYMLLGPALGLLGLIVWGLVPSGLRFGMRAAVLGLAGACCAVAALLVHASAGLALYLYGVPLSTVVILCGLRFTWAAVPAARLAIVGLLLAAAWSVFPLLRIDGFTGSYFPELAWRWSPTAEQQLSKITVTSTGASAVWNAVDAPWPGFRGVGRDGRAHVTLAAGDWSSAEPTELWRIAVGPGWGSFALASGRLYTQEQRGEQEVVSCYDAQSGVALWTHQDQLRFSDVVAGPGPRATPTYAGGKLFTYGSKAMLNCLDAETGALLWQRDLMKEVQAMLPVWGFANSPLVSGSVVIVYAGGKGDNGLVAYDVESGEPVWQIRSTGMNFSSAQTVELCGQTFVVFGDAAGLQGIDPSSGTILWQYRPEKWKGPSMCQPQAITADSLIAALGDGVGLARLDLTCEDRQWEIRERWSTTRIRPAFNDYVYHDGHVYGFNQSVFACLDADTGKGKWKGGRYGFGQVVLLPEAGQMIVLAEDGQSILLDANPQRLEERGRLQTLTGKTWNHPIVVDDRLFVRNGAEAACYQLH